ncbi:hypothetical protein HPB48_019901 [Haemaphysalis longicornis]|uniref:ATP-dependent DNA helicase n=1 Tax=Haemaphysalis longicornis TaxID=44386 RepID=A0A9J6GMC4_HAELO|nr:hypothetical protein HPB48_019901 [Haemaphysalis longicornis]
MRYIILEEVCQETCRIDERVSTTVHAGEDTDIRQGTEYAGAVTAAVRKRDDILCANEYNDLMRRTNLRLLVQCIRCLHNHREGGSALGRTTVLAAFQLMRHNEGGLRDSDLNAFRTAFMNVGCNIFAEVSMLSADTFDHIDSCLRQITSKYDVPFSGIDVVLCVDLRQSPHIRANEEIELIQSRFVTAELAASIPAGAVRIFYANKEVDAFNSGVALQDVDDVREASAMDSNIGYKSSHECERAQAKFATMTHTEKGNLPSAILLARWKAYMLTANMDAKYGLVNGAVSVL